MWRRIPGGRRRVTVSRGIRRSHSLARVRQSVVLVLLLRRLLVVALLVEGFVGKNVVKNSGTTVKNKTKKIARSSISYTIYLFFAVFWGCHCIWASASVRGHPREKHLVYVVGAGSRATHCKNAAANGLPLAEKTAKSHSKCHAIGFFGAVSSRSSHRSVGHRLPCGRRRSETTWWTSGPQDVGLCVVRVCGENAHRANRWQTAARNLGEKERALFNARDRFA